jgi:hypothetical protein
MNADQYRQIAVGHPGAVDYGAEYQLARRGTPDALFPGLQRQLTGRHPQTQYIANLNYRNLEGNYQQSTTRCFTPALK